MLSSGNNKFILALRQLHNVTLHSDLGDDIDEDDDQDEDLDLSISLSQIQQQLKEPKMAKLIASLPKLPWPQKIRLMEYADLSDEQAAQIFDTHTYDVFLKRVKYLADDSWVLGQYANCIKLLKRSISRRRESAPVSKEGKPIQGTKIKDALQSVTEIPAKVTDLAERFNISVHVLKQFSRFSRPEFYPAGMTIIKQTINRECYLRLVPIKPA